MSRLVLAAQLVAVAHGASPLQPIDANDESGHMCLDGRVVPRLYIIGHQKSATTSIAHMLMEAGARSAGYNPGSGPLSDKNGCYTKEIHFFDTKCPSLDGDDRYPTCSASGHDLKPWGAPRKPGLATKDRPHQYAMCDDWQSACKPGNGKVAGAPWDFTPNSAVIPGLAYALHSRLSGMGAHKFSFYVLLREGLTRMSSDFYMVKKDKLMYNKNQWVQQPFTKYAQGVLNEFPDYWAAKKAVKKNSQSLQGKNLAYGRSLASLFLEDWLKAWGPQLTLVPFMWPMRNTKDFVEILLSKSNAPTGIDPEKIPDQLPGLMQLKHPSPEDDMSAELVDTFRKQHFDPDMRELARMVKKHGAHVIGIGEMSLFGKGVTKGNWSEEFIHGHLTDNMLETSTERSVRMGGSERSGMGGPRA